jgi:hypothetical protein
MTRTEVLLERMEELRQLHEYVQALSRATLAEFEEHTEERRRALAAHR